MSKFHVVLVVLCAAITASPAIAAPKKRMSSIGAIRLACVKEAGAYYRPGDGRWYVQGGIGTAQVQRFYDCLDAHTMKRR